MGVLTIHDGVRVTLGCDDSGGSMNLVGDVGFNVSRTDASGGNEQIMEITPKGPDFHYVEGTLDGSPGQHGWWFPCYLTEEDAKCADAVYRGWRCGGSATALTFVEYPGVAFYMPSEICAQPQPSPFVFDEQIGCGNAYSSPDDPCVSQVDEAESRF